ncbi:MAG: hypothetical protein AB2L09_03165 [Coriobacteriia bacterium]
MNNIDLRQVSAEVMGTLARVYPGAKVESLKEEGAGADFSDLYWIALDLIKAIDTLREPTTDLAAAIDALKTIYMEITAHLPFHQNSIEEYLPDLIETLGGPHVWDQPEPSAG